MLHKIAILIAEPNEGNFGDNYNSDAGLRIHEESVTQPSQLNIDPRNRLVQEYFLPLLNSS